MPRVTFEHLKIGERYNRKFLAESWEYGSWEAIAKGVITPRNHRVIVLFVTRIKQRSLTQYHDYVSGDRLYWDGEKKHGTDLRIRDAERNGDEIHLFYREVHHSAFEYRGRIQLEDASFSRTGPSKFAFRLEHDHSAQDDIALCASDLLPLGATERDVVVAARLGQGRFRRNLIEYWKGCSMTGVEDASLLRASHIKPWRSSTNTERLEPWNGLLLLPHFDHVFDRGLISFRDTGAIVISPALGTGARRALGLDDALHLRQVDNRHLDYLRYHRYVYFEKHGQ